MTTSASINYNDYIELSGPVSTRYGSNKLINITNYLSQYLQQTDTKYFLQIFEEYWNAIFDGEDGFSLSAINLPIDKYYVSASGTSGGISGTGFDVNDRDFNYDLGTSSTSAVPTYANNEAIKVIINLPSNYLDSEPKISILEKISRIRELQDPELIPLEFISRLSNNLGYSVDVSREDMIYNGDISVLSETESTEFSAVDVGKYLRFMIANLPEWYKIKGTKNAIKVLLYSFGLIGDVNEYYTKDYIDNWLISDNSLLENIPNTYYPSPHFAVRINIDDSVGSISFDDEKRLNVINAINSIRPINTVFEKLNGYAVRILPTITININTRVRMNMLIT